MTVRSADAPTRAESLLWLVAIVFWLWWAIVSLGWPLGRDEGIFVWLGQVVSRGGVPYRDAWDTKGPAVFAVSGLARLVFGRQLWGIRAVDLIVAALGALILAAAARRLDSRRAAGYAAALFLLWHAGLRLWPTAQPDGWAAVALAAGFLPLLGAAPPGPLGWIAAGLGVGVATLVKPLYVLFAAVPIARALADRALPRRWRARAVGIAAGSAAAVGAATLLWFWAKGAIGDLWDAQVGFNFGTYAAGSELTPLGRVRAMLDFFALPPVAVVLPAAALAAAELRRRAGAAMAAVGIWLVVAIVCVALQGRFFGYQWLVAYPPLLLLAAAGIAALFARGERVVAATLVLLAFWLPTREPTEAILAHRAFSGGRITEEAYLRRFSQYGDPHFESETRAAAAYLYPRMAPGARLLVWGTQPVLHALTGRPAASRFGFNLPLVAGGDTPLRRKYRAAFLGELGARPPAYVVVVAGDRTDLVPLASDEYLHEFAELRDLLERRYRHEATFGPYLIYRRIG